MYEETDDIKRIIFNKRWLSDGIGDAYKNWHLRRRFIPMHSPTCVLIESATGTGKTSFILDKLLPYAIENARNILYISNRNALESQIKNGLSKKMTQLKNKGFEQISTFVDPQTKKATVIVCNYQSICALLEYVYKKNIPLYYVILDESHFFIEDSLFNRNTWFIFDNIMRHFGESVLIFMSATLCDCEELISAKKKSYHPQHSRLPEIYQHLYHDKIEIYNNTFCNSTYIISHYNKEDELIYKINNSKVDEKWLIFVRTKNDGKKLAKDIRTTTNRTVRFISARSKETKTWNNLVENSKFNTNILIATRVIDNGINIKDNSVKHIVLPFCDRVDFLQMLGRRRNFDNETIHVYVERPNIRTINAQKYHWRLVMNQIREYERIEKDYLETFNYPKYQHDMENFIKKIWNNENHGADKAFYMNNPGQLILNDLVSRKIKLLSKFYDDLTVNYKNPDQYLNKVLNWLNMPENTTINHIYSENCSTLDEFIAHFLNKTIMPEEFELFYSCFQYYYTKYCYNLFEEKPDIYDKSLKIKKGTAHRKATINNSLKFINFPYKVIKEDNCWILLSSTQVSSD